MEARFNSFLRWDQVTEDGSQGEKRLWRRGSTASSAKISVQNKGWLSGRPLGRGRSWRRGSTASSGKISVQNRGWLSGRPPGRGRS
jgi:hypothetical protein